MQRAVPVVAGLVLGKLRGPSPLAALAVIAGLLTASAPPVLAATAAFPSASAATAASTSGDKAASVSAGAIPHGITLSGLESWLPAAAALSPGAALPAAALATMKAQIYAARHYWHANVVRFQVIQDKLVGADGRVFSAAYMRDIRTVTGYALSQGLSVVLNAQTEMRPGFTRDETLPTPATWSFWRHLMVFYANDPAVIFDLFNEPRYCSWARWHRAMQGLVDDVRQAGARNTLWAEGRWWGSTLAGVPLLRGRGIVYSFHHPGAPWEDQAPVTVATWNRAFGNLASRGIPVVDGEFTNFAGGYHFNHPRALVRQYLQYLRAHHIGMTAWTLLPGVLNSTTGYASATTEPAGDGWLVKQWFAGLG